MPYATCDIYAILHKVDIICISWYGAIMYSDFAGEFCISPSAAKKRFKVSSGAIVRQVDWKIIEFLFGLL